LHCTIGSSSLAQSGATLVASNLSSTDGFGIQLSNASFWSSDVELHYGIGFKKIVWEPVEDGAATSRLHVEQFAADSFYVRAEFTGAPSGSLYRIEAFNGGTLKAAQDSAQGLPPIQVVAAQCSGRSAHVAKWYADHGGQDRTDRTARIR
jgi:hypothetical protein